jgi:rhamnulokinase
VSRQGGVRGDIRLLKNISGLWLLQECVRQWQAEGREYTGDEVVQLAAEAAPFRSLVDVDASEFLAPENMPLAIREYCRRTGQTQPESDGAMARCCLESLSLKYLCVLEAPEALTARDLKVIRIVGGGSQNKLLSQLTADVCQRRVVAGPVEASALGNVMMQAVATGRLRSIAEGRQSLAASANLTTYEPRPVAGLEDVCRRFCNLGL